MDPTEIAIQNAFQDLDSGQISSMRDAASKWDVTKSTLHMERKGRINQHKAQLPQQRLTPDQENFLADWIIEQDAQEFSLLHPYV